MTFLVSIIIFSSLQCLWTNSCCNYSIKKSTKITLVGPCLGSSSLWTTHIPGSCCTLLSIFTVEKTLCFNTTKFNPSPLLHFRKHHPCLYRSQSLFSHVTLFTGSLMNIKLFFRLKHQNPTKPYQACSNKACLICCHLDLFCLSVSSTFSLNQHKVFGEKSALNLFVGKNNYCNAWVPLYTKSNATITSFVRKRLTSLCGLLVKFQQLQNVFV